MDCTPHIHLAAYHAAPGYNGDTPGLGVLCPLSPGLRLGAGAYYNSVRKQSAYAGFSYQPWRLGAVAVGAFGGVVTGYQAGPIPFAAAVASVDLGAALRLHAAAIPHVQSVSPATVEFSIELRF